MSDGNAKKDIIKALEKHRDEITEIIEGFEGLDESDDGRLNRILAQGIVITVFEFVDGFVNTEINIHNFMRGRG